MPTPPAAPGVRILADIGGTWIKLAVADDGALTPRRIVNPCRDGRPGDFRATLETAIAETLAGRTPAGIGISTAGIVNDAGDRLVAGHAYLDPLKDPGFLPALRTTFGCPAVMINDADAALIGAAERGHLRGHGCHALLALGTGCGFALWKNGLRWRPDRKLVLLGALRTPAGSFDELCSASALAARTAEGRLDLVFTEPRYATLLNEYLDNLARLIDNAALLHHCESVLLAGGLVAAAGDTGYDLAAALAPRLMPTNDFHRAPRVVVAPEGNDLPLLGVRALIDAEIAAAAIPRATGFASLPTEALASPELRLERCTPAELIARCLDNENAVATAWNSQAHALTAAATRLAAALAGDGRLIYVGCGTSGRLAACDATELNCTFGLPKDRAIALISGGVAEASASIEENREEDTSACPELLLVQPRPADVVIGVSASGSAWYVRSALALARARGAYTILLANGRPADGLCDLHIDLQSGPELVTGSTRMKAGTVTKKILNALSTAAMILCGKVRGSHMIDVACLNDKLVTRACGILAALHGLSRDDALALLRRHDMRLADALRDLESGDNTGA